MSLTRFLKNKDVKEKFREFSMPELLPAGELKAPPKTENYSLVGTAFDYLMRFYLKKINPSAVTQKWIAEYVIKIVDDKKTLKIIKNILTSARRSYKKYLKTGEITEETIKSCLYLAQLDPIYRALIIDQNIGIVNPEDVADMKNLIQLVDAKLFNAKICILNPGFGKASKLVSGADMDILLDNVLLDIKTTKYLEFKREYLNQLIGYYILSRIGGIDNAPKNIKIEFLGIYFSRHGLLYKVPISEVIKSCDLTKFISWFKERAEQQYKRVIK